MSAGVQAQSDEGLVAEWHFDEGSGSVLKDSSGNGNDGVIYGATWVEGKYGKALSFDGVDDYVEVIESKSSRPETITIDSWIKLNSLPSSCSFIILKTHSNSWASYYLGIDNTGKVILSTQNQKLNQWPVWKSVTQLNTNTLYHIVGVFNKTNSNDMDGSIYINGDEIATTFTANGYNSAFFIGYDAGKLDIGKEGGTINKYYFNGIIDEVRIYDRALSAEEIKNHYNGVGLIVKKTTSLHSIKQGQTTTISLDLKNSYLTEIKDIEIVDIIPSDRIQVSGETSKTFASLQPKDSIEFQYILRIDKVGTCNLDPATVTFADKKGNYYIVKSNAVSIEVIPTPTPTSTSTPTTTSTLTTTPIPIQTSTPILTSTPTQTPTSISTPTPYLPSDLSPPAISILNPVIIEYNNNGLLEEGEKVKISYGANDPSGVSSVKIRLDGVMLESRNQAGTYTVTTNSLPVGVHTIRVEATDSKSNYNSEELPITVERTGPSVYFGTTKTMIHKGENAIFTLSAVNPIGNPPIEVQLILKPPSCVSVTSSSFAKGASGIYTCTQTIESGDNVRSINVDLTGNQVGTHEIESQVYYLFDGSPRSPTQYDTLTLVVEPNPLPTEAESPGFAVVVTILVFMIAACIIIRNK